MFTEIQKIIIKDVCSIQFKSLEELLVTVNLNEEYENILIALDIPQKEWDMTLVETYNRFKKVEENPEDLFTIFQDMDTLVFKYILFYWAHKWEPIYRNDFLNLWDKLFLWSCFSPN